jgi:hypothetical protein
MDVREEYDPCGLCSPGDEVFGTLVRVSGQFGQPLVGLGGPAPVQEPPGNENDDQDRHGEHPGDAEAAVFAARRGPSRS